MPDTQPVRKIIHIDCDCFYAAVEMRDNPQLVGKPIAVGGTPDKRGVVATCNYEARAYGVHSAMPSQKALKLCPDLILIKPRHEVYKVVSQQIHRLFQDYTSIIEPLSLDEAYLDVTQSDLYDNCATKIAQTIQKRIEQEVGISASAGVAPNKFLAKIASDWKKPRGLFVIPPSKVNDFIIHLPITKLHGVGHVAAKKLHQRGVNTCYDLQQISRTELLRSFGSLGEKLWYLAQGIDNRAVQSSRRQSVSVEQTFSQDIPTLDLCLIELPELLDKLWQRLHGLSDEYKTGKPFVKIKFHDFTQTTLEQQSASITLTSYQHLLTEAYQRGNKPIRLLGIGVRLIDLHVLNKQLSLFDENII